MNTEIKEEAKRILLQTWGNIPRELPKTSFRTKLEEFDDECVKFLLGSAEEPSVVPSGERMAAIREAALKVYEAALRGALEHLARREYSPLVLWVEAAFMQLPAQELHEVLQQLGLSIDIKAETQGVDLEIDPFDYVYGLPGSYTRSCLAEDILDQPEMNYNKAADVFHSKKSLTTIRARINLP